MEVRRGFGQCITAGICRVVVWLCVLVCQACINIPQTDWQQPHVSALLFSSQLPWKSAIFAHKDSHGWLFDVLSSSLSFADNWVPRTPAGHYSFPFPVSCHHLSCFLFTPISWVYLNSIQKQATITSQGTTQNHWNVHLEKALN